MKVLHICYSDFDGGAAKAANRLHQAQRNAGIESYMLVVNKTTSDSSILTVSKMMRIKIKILSRLSNFFVEKLIDNNPIKHSLNVIPTGLAKLINKLNPDIVNIHWIGDNMMSIGEVAKIKAPIVWTMHDMWAFSGCEHYDTYPELRRYQDDYKSLPGTKKIDINRIIFKYKNFRWKKKNIQFVSPSRWLAECAGQTSITVGKKIYVIQNTIDHNVFSPVDRAIARKLLALPMNKKIILFGAMSSISDLRKGFYLLNDALASLSHKHDSEYALVIFGAEKKKVQLVNGFETYNLGVLNDELSLRLLYSAADVYVAPSLQDNLPNTLVEAFAVGTPCVAFNIGGMPDLITEGCMGKLVFTIHSDELGMAIEDVLSSQAEKHRIYQASLQSRAGEVIVDSYNSVYDNA